MMIEVNLEKMTKFIVEHSNCINQALSKYIFHFVNS